MTHHIKPEVEARPGPGHTDSARGLGLDDDALLDHHIEELLGALGGLDRLGSDGNRDTAGRLY